MARKSARFTITPELTKAGRERFRVQHPDPNRPGRYVSRRWDTEGEAGRFLDNLDRYGLAAACEIDETAKGKAAPPRWSVVPLGEYLTTVYLPTRAYANHSASAMAHRVAIINRHDIGAMPISQVTTATVRRFRAWLTTAPRLDGRGTLSTRTQNFALDLIRSVMAYAVAAGEVERHPALPAVVPPIEVTDALESCPVTLAEFDAIVAQMDDPTYRAFFRTMLHTGGRITEVPTIRWDEMVPATLEGFVRVHLHGTKTKNADRWVTIPASVLEGAPDDHTDGLVFGTRRANAYRVAWNNAVRRAQNPARAALEGHPVLTITPRPHDLRHSHAAFLFESGADPVAISRRMGHAHLGITERLYGKLTDAHTENVGAMVAEVMRRR